GASIQPAFIGVLLSCARGSEEGSGPIARESAKMNTRAILSTAAAAALFLASGATLADDYDDYGYDDDHGRRAATYDYARVLSVTPNVRYVTVRAPVRECWEETRHYTVDRHPQRNVAGTLMGAVL